MRRYNPFYFIGQAFEGLWRNGVMSFASIAVLMSLLVVTGGFTLLVANINKNLDEFNSIKQIVVFCEQDATDEEIAVLGDTIGKLDNIEKVQHVTKKEGLEKMKAEYEAYSDVSEEDNPLPDSFVITYIDNEKVSDLDYQLKNLDGVVKVNNRLDLATKIESFKRGVMLVFAWFLVILGVVSFFIIMNTIKLSVFSRRNEISIMQYVGATGWFISLPYIIEGIIIGIIASVAAYFIEWYIYFYFVEMVHSNLQFISFIPFTELKGTVLLGFIAIGIGAGIIGSLVSLARYLRQ